MKHSSRLVECVTVHEVYVRTYVVVKSPDKAFAPLRGREEKKRKENENKRVIQDGRGCRGRIPLLGLGEAQPTAVRRLPRSDVNGCCVKGGFLENDTVITKCMGSKRQGGVC